MTKRPRSTSPARANGENAAKINKVDPTQVDPAVIKKQIEYYLSDENLAGDKMFYDKIKEDKDGYLSIDLIMACNKIKQMRIEKEQIFKAIAASEKVEGKDSKLIRRKDNKELPTFTGIRPGKFGSKKSMFNDKLNTNAMGVILEISNIPDSIEFGPVKTAVKAVFEANEEFSKKVPNFSKKVSFCGMKKEGKVFMSVLPFSDNLKFFKENLTTVTVKEETSDAKKEFKLPVNCLIGSQMDSALKTLPQKVKDDLKKAHRNFTHHLAKNKKQIRLANLNFDNVQAIKKKVREIQAMRGNGEEIKKDGTDYNLILEILKYHPSAKKKMEKMTGIKVDESSFGGTRCFYVIRDGGESEDFSITKALQALEANPPYLEKKTEEKKE